MRPVQYMIICIFSFYLSYIYLEIDIQPEIKHPVHKRIDALGLRIKSFELKVGHRQEVLPCDIYSELVHFHLLNDFIR